MTNYDFNLDPRFEGVTRIPGKCLLASPTMHGGEERYVHDAFESGWVTTAGENINELEKFISEFIGIDNAVALSSGTAALHLAIKLAGEKIYGQPKPGHAFNCTWVICQETL
jgi:dTDP-4-amino-4,6-dideoxygalactose transaminase